MNDESAFVLIGVVRRAYGVRGEISLLPISDIPGRFTALKYVLVREGSCTSEFAVESVRAKGKEFLLKLRGIDDRTSADGLLRADVGVRKKDVYPVGEDTYYVYDLVGCEVVGETGREIGVVEDVLKMPANDVFVVMKEGREALIPAVKRVIKQVDLKARRIVVEELEGLLD